MVSSLESSLNAARIHVALAFTVVFVAFSIVATALAVAVASAKCSFFPIPYFYVSFIHVCTIRQTKWPFSLCIYSSSTLTLVNFHALLCAMSVLCQDQVFHFDIFR